MSKASYPVQQLYALRNRFGGKLAAQKIDLLQGLAGVSIHDKTSLQLYYDCLLFLQAYPDNKQVQQAAGTCLQQLQQYIYKSAGVQQRLFNSGMAGTELCSSFSFEMVKWFRKHQPDQIRFDSFEADEGKISSVLSVVLPRVESEVFQDGNETWRSWLNQAMNKKEELLDRLLAVFDEADISPFVRDELWSSLGLNTVIGFSVHAKLPDALIKPFYHRSLLKKNSINVQTNINPKKIALTETQAQQIIACARTILVQHLREIDPITFTEAPYVSYYHLSRGISIALMGMRPERRSPLDCYMGYMVFKNGLPVAYAGSWILFNSGRIGLNIFPSYRGGESKLIFEQILNLHTQVYGLHRLTVDPYQLGKDNSDGIHSGAFWIYYRAGFRPLKKEQHELAKAEAKKIRSNPLYRSPEPVLKKLADSRMELLLQKNAVRFDATDLSRTYYAILKEQYQNDHRLAREHSLLPLVRSLQLKYPAGDTMHRILSNWTVLLLSNGKVPAFSNTLKQALKKLFELKCSGSEEEYIRLLQRSTALRKFMEEQVSKHLEP